MVCDQLKFLGLRRRSEWSPDCEGSPDLLTDIGEEAFDFEVTATDRWLLIMVSAFRSQFFVSRSPNFDTIEER